MSFRKKMEGKAQARCFEAQVMTEIRAWEEIDVDVRRLIGRAIASHKLRVVPITGPGGGGGWAHSGKKKEKTKPKKNDSRGSLHGRDIGTP